MLQRLLIANRGEIALRIMRAAADLDIETIAVYAEEDASALHVRRADRAIPLAARGARAYLDIDRIVAVALEAGCDAVHPGYGFLAENAEFARRVAAAGMTFVGPRVDLLESFGDKTQARALARAAGVNVLPGSGTVASPEAAEAFFRSLPGGAGMVIKAVAGGGGRGMRIVRDVAEILGIVRARMRAVEDERQALRGKARNAQDTGDGFGHAVPPSCR